jgi:hypothetical protein
MSILMMMMKKKKKKNVTEYIAYETLGFTSTNPIKVEDERQQDHFGAGRI